MGTMSDDVYDDDELEEESSLTGVSISLPKFYKWKVGAIYDYDGMIVDYENLDDLARATNKARRALFVITDKLNEYERKEKLSKLAYDREYRREYLTSSEKTESAKRARAELKCEELENEWQTYVQLNSELTRLSHSMRQELQILQSIGNNLRQQLKI